MLVGPVGTVGSLDVVGAGGGGPDDGPDGPGALLVLFAEGHGGGAVVPAPTPRSGSPLPPDELDVAVVLFTFQVQPFTSWQRLFELRDVHEGG